MDARICEKRAAALAYLQALMDPAEPDTELVELVRAGSRLLSVDRGEMICTGHMPQTGCFSIMDGTVKLSLLAADGSERVLALLTRGCSFGESASWLGRSGKVCAEAVQDSRLLLIGRDTIRVAVQRCQDFSEALLQRLSEQSLRLIEELHASTFLRARDRVVRLLLDQLDLEPSPAHPPEIHLPACKALIAARLDMTPETFSREIHALARAGLVAVERRRVVLHDVEALRGILESS